MSIDDADAALRITEAGRQRVLARLQDAVDEQLRAHPDADGLDPETLAQLLEQGVQDAGPSLWRISLAEGAADQFGIGVREALAHPAVAVAGQLIGLPGDETPMPQPVIPDPEPVPERRPDPEPAPQPVTPEPAPAPIIPEPEPEPVAPLSPAAIAVPQALRIAAVHAGGIDSLAAGDEDIELRLSEAGLDVIKRSSGIAIGRLDWGQITTIEVQEPGKRGLRRRRSANRTLQVGTGGGHAVFELVGLSDEETAEHLEPMLSRLRASGALAAA